MLRKKFRNFHIKRTLWQLSRFKKKNYFESIVYIMVRNLHLTNGKRQTPYKKKQNVTMG
jgi:hypothetical protein